MMDRWTKIVVAVGVPVILVLVLGIYTETKECEEKGGERLRGMLQGYKCYDARTLKVLP
jgi:hypothetical protein